MDREKLSKVLSAILRGNPYLRTVPPDDDVKEKPVTIDDLYDMTPMRLMNYIHSCLDPTLESSQKIDPILLQKLLRWSATKKFKTTLISAYFPHLLTKQPEQKKRRRKRKRLTAPKSRSAHKLKVTSLVPDIPIKKEPEVDDEPIQDSLLEEEEEATSCSSLTIKKETEVKVEVVDETYFYCNVCSNFVSTDLETHRSVCTGGKVTSSPTAADDQPGPCRQDETIQSDQSDTDSIIFEFPAKVNNEVFDVSSGNESFGEESSKNNMSKVDNMTHGGDTKGESYPLIEHSYIKTHTANTWMEEEDVELYNYALEKSPPKNDGPSKSKPKKERKIRKEVHPKEDTSELRKLTEAIQNGRFVCYLCPDRKSFKNKNTLYNHRSMYHRDFKKISKADKIRQQSRQPKYYC